MITAARTPPHLLTLIILTAVSIISLNMFLPSLANMAKEFGVSYSVMNISVAGYLAVTAVLQIIIGPLSDRYGRRPVLLGSIVIFCLATIGCIFATNIWVFLTLRIVQGAVIAGAALSRAVVRDMMESKDAVKIIATISMAMAIAPMIGPMFGGMLAELFGWRSNFWFYLIIGLALLVLIWADLGETNKEPSDTFRQQFSTYPELLGSNRFWGYTICMSTSVGCFYGFLSGVPLIATEVLNLPLSQFGLFMGSPTLGFFVSSFLARRFSWKFELTQMILIGRIIPIFGLTVGLILVLMGHVTPLVIFGSAVFIGLGNGFSLPSSHVGIMNVRTNLAGSASGLSGAISVGFGAVLAMLMGAFLTAENGAVVFLGLLLVTKVISLVFGIWVHILERRANEN
jgi:Bcr/CflA subfamily drug resistance transporter